MSALQKWLKGDKAGQSWKLNLAQKMKSKAKIASRTARCKAFLIDIFLLYVPIIYICYFVLGSKEAFKGNQLVIFACWALFGLIQGVFLAAKAQSPGLKAYDLFLIDKNTGGKLGFLRIMLRYIVFLAGCALLIGLFISFVRKDKLALHDIISQSVIVRKVENAPQTNLQPKLR